MVISEYVEGSSNNKALELYNCGAEIIDLSTVGVCLENNGGDVMGGGRCNQQSVLSGTLAPGAVFTICNPTLPGAGACDVQSGNLTSFNGDDRVIIFDDANGSATFEPGADGLFDVLGTLGEAPADRPWADVTLRRCDFTPFDGVSPFDLGRFEMLVSDTFDGLGDLTATCD